MLGLLETGLIGCGWDCVLGFSDLTYWLWLGLGVGVVGGLGLGLGSGF